MASVLGATRLNMWGEILGTGYREFTSSIGISGLYKTNGPRLDLLAVIASDPGSGQFRAFINQAKEEFQTIVVWEILNPILNDILERYQFVQTEKTEDGECLKGWKWEAPV